MKNYERILTCNPRNSSINKYNLHKQQQWQTNHHLTFVFLPSLLQNIQDFSRFQLERVVEFSKITEMIEGLRREVNEEDETSGSWRIASNDETRFTLRKRHGRKHPPEDVFSKRFRSDEPRETSKSDEHRHPYSILTEASLTDFYTSEIKNPMDRRFVVVPALAQEMDRKTSSLNFLQRKRKDEDDEEDEDEEKRKNIGLLKLKKMDSDNSDDDDDDDEKGGCVF